LALPLVTIVTPSYNHAAYLEKALRSVADQDYARIEHIVVDGGSTDGSVEIIRSFADRLAWWESEPDGGQAAALNKAFARANGDILGWLNSDDELLPGAITAVVEALEQDPEAVLAYGDNIVVNEESGARNDLEGLDLDVVRMVRTWRNWVPQPGSLFRRRAWELAGPFDAGSYYYFDFEFVLRLLFAGAKTMRIDKPLAVYRIHPKSKTGGETLKKAYDHRRLEDAVFSRSDVPPAVRVVEREARARSAFVAAEFFLGAGERRRARHELLRGLALAPRAVSRWTLRLSVQAFVPRRVVERMTYFEVVRRRVEPQPDDWAGRPLGDKREENTRRAALGVRPIRMTEPLRASIRRRLPPRVLAATRAVRPVIRRMAREVAPLSDYLQILRLSEARGKFDEREPIHVRILPLGGLTVTLRPGTSDASVVLDTFLARYHLPPDDIEPRVIWDLGSNIGLTIAHFAVLYPGARITGLEPEPAAAALARLHIQRWSERCRIVEAAAWVEDGELSFVSEPGNEFGGRVLPGLADTTLRVRAMSLNTLLAGEGEVDYLKMDVEGAEEQILRLNTDWVEKVGCIKVEVHAPYSLERCVDDLRRLGFSTRVDPAHWAAVVGRR
jgi:FkbM family methyltransferase